jgi:hypothetical protein
MARQERKYFDSGDYALSKAGKASDAGVTQIGREHPVPENIPHATTTTQGPGAVGVPIGLPIGPTTSNSSVISGSTIPSLQQTSSNLSGLHSHSPVKESRLQRETSADDVDGEEEVGDENDEEEEQEYEAAKKSKVGVVPGKK